MGKEGEVSMNRKKKALFISGLFLLSMFLILAVTPQTPFAPSLAAQSSTQQLVGAKADPSSEDYPPWWDVNYDFRREIVFNNTASLFAVVNRPIDVFMTFASGKCHHDTVRVQFWNSTSHSWEPGTSDGIPYQIWNDTSTGDYYDSFTITFYINVSACESVSYFIYYDDGPGYAPSFTSEVS